MARDTDRKCVSEAVRLSNGAWSIEHLERHRMLLLPRRSNGGEALALRFGSVGQIVEAWHEWPGCRNGIVTRKRERVLKIIEGKK
jgi:hypothetical protein